MTRHLILTASAFGLLLGMGAPVSATKPTPPGVTYHGNHQGVIMGQNDSIDSIVAVFPLPAPSMTQFVITLPTMADESAYRVGIMAGKMEETDGVNRVGISGQLMERNLAGWGYNYFEVEGGNGPSMSTMIGVPPGTPRVVEFLSLQEKLVRYNSRLPLIIYAPTNFEVRYRVFAAGTEQSALVGPSGATESGGGISIQPIHVPGRVVPDSSGATRSIPGGAVSHSPSGDVISGGPGSSTRSGGVTNGRTTGGIGYVPQPIRPEPSGDYNGRTISSPVYGGPTRVSPPSTGLTNKDVKLGSKRKLNIPTGSTATVKLYDAMMDGPEDSFASHSMPISKVPMTVTMPDAKMDGVALAAVYVGIYDPSGALIYENEQTTTVNFNGATILMMARPGAEDEGNDFE